MITNNCEPFQIEDIKAFTNIRKEKLTDFDLYGLQIATAQTLALFNQDTDGYTTDLDESQALRDETACLLKYMTSDSDNHGNYQSVSILDGMHDTYHVTTLYVNSMQGDKVLSDIAYNKTWLTDNGIMVMEFNPITNPDDLSSINYDETIYIRVN